MLYATITIRVHVPDDLDLLEQSEEEERALADKFTATVYGPVEIILDSANRDPHPFTTTIERE